MLLPFTLAAVSFLSASAPVFPLGASFDIAKVGTLPTPSFSTLKETEPVVETPDVSIKEEEEKPKRLICRGCNDNENRTLAFFQERGITDKYALATIMGNIRQESTFVPNICEGGARTSYNGCYSGGYGLIQWTSSNRYAGLGRHANRNGMNPSTLEAQLSYLVTEPQWRGIENRMQTPGKSIERYMNYAYRWIGWGHHGGRTHYAYDYARRFTLDS